jgi:hypothetical protein
MKQPRSPTRLPHDAELIPDATAAMPDDSAFIMPLMAVRTP